MKDIVTGTRNGEEDERIAEEAERETEPSAVAAAGNPDSMCGGSFVFVWKAKRLHDPENGAVPNGGKHHFRRREYIF